MLVQAPPGYRKSEILTFWYRQCLAERQPCAWLTLDASDDTETVIAHLAALLASARANAAAAIGPKNPHVRDVTAIVSAIERREQEARWFIDDLDDLSSDVITKVILPLVRLRPPNLSLVLASSAPGRLPVAAEVERRRGRIVGEAELRLQRGDIFSSAGRAVSDHQARNIDQQSRGWPVLAGWLVDDVVSAGPDTSDERIGRFYEERLALRLTGEERRLLEQLALLPRFSSLLVGDLMKGDSWRKQLTRLTEFGLVEQIAADEDLDLKVHPAFLRYLAGDADSLRPQAATRWRRRALDACLGRRAFVAAAQIAADLRDPAALVKVVNACDPLSEWLSHGIDSLHRIVRLIPKQLQLDYPQIGFACVICMVTGGRVMAGGELLEQLERTWARRNVQGRPLTPRLQLERAICRTLIAVYQGHTVAEDDLQTMMRLGAEAGDVASLLNSATESLRVYMLQSQNRLTDALELARSAVRNDPDPDLRYSDFFHLCDAAVISGLQGEIGRAAEFLSQADRNCHVVLRSNERLTLVRDSFRIELEHERDPLNFDALERLRNICRRLPACDAWPDVYSAAFRTYSEKLALSGDMPAALALIEAGIIQARREGVGLLERILQYHRIVLLAMDGRSGSAVEEADALVRSEAHLGEEHWRLIEVRAEARLALAIVSPAHAPPAPATGLLDAMERSGNVRSLLRLGRYWDALGPEHCNRARLAKLETKTGYCRARLIVDRLQSNASGEKKAAVSQPAPSRFFTPRQAQVLHFLALGLSDKVIAAELGISAHGVRYHLKRIYAQLNVNSRRQAISRAPRAHSDAPY